MILTSQTVSPEVECGVATPAAIAKKRAQLLDFIGRVQRAYAWADTHHEAFAQVYAADTGLPIAIARYVRARQEFQVLPAITDEAIAEHQSAADVYADVGLIPKRLDIAQVYDRGFALQPLSP